MALTFQNSKVHSMSASRTCTITTTSTAGSSRPRPQPPLPPIPPPMRTKYSGGHRSGFRGLQERALRAQQQEEAVTERRRVLAAAATARSRRGTSPSEVSASPRRPVVEVPKARSKGKDKTKAQPMGEDPDDNNDEERAPCERCRGKKIPCQMQAGKRSSIICKPCHDAKVQCSYSTRPFTVKQEGGSNPTGEQLAVLESQMAQLLADNRQLREGQVKANTYHRHFNKKLDWLMVDAARRRKSPPEMPEAGPSGLSRKCRRVVDSDEEEEEEKEVEKGIEGEVEEEAEKEGEGEGEAPAPKRARSEEGKEREDIE
ncbi:hypothetical protein EV359DRAFT_87790 [Lentinula novae-zelandiae]|nr:hypothetical protein EV359DRAFT_87790 [Lentinula novae-zelandiae]